ncbi:zinc ribbon domain-containing protein [Levilactobacillus tangyuanensis]|uniref:Zinc ribbon domain-containing protein n=1 Tax=Levilactobacillus tangyuanensis TaxID=2486021 RepID=A0ABW1TLE4_9LACO|nr:zinc-ribbon domain-containing protein [Levilactobacillus tangyuanensis]
MKECPNCHQPVTPGSAFCDHCGYDLRQAQPTAVTDSTPETAEPHRRRNGKGKRRGLLKSRKKKTGKPAKKGRWFKRVIWSIIAIAGVIVLVLALSFYNKQAGKDKQIDNMADMITGNQSDDLAKVLLSDNPSLKIDGDTVQPFLTYARTHPKYVDSMKASLKQSGETTDQTFKLVTDGHNFLIFPIYKLRVTTMHPTVATNVDNATIVANGDDLVTSKSDHYVYKAGPLFPGHYKFKLTGSRSTASQSVNLISSGDNDRQIDLIAKSLKAEKSTTNNNNDDSNTTDNSNNNSQVQQQTGNNPKASDYTDQDDVDSDQQDAIDSVSDEFDYPEDDFDFKVSEPYTDVYQVKVYDNANDHSLFGTYRYDDIHDVYSEYNTDTGKFDPA